MAKRMVSPAQRQAELGAAILFLLTAVTSITGELLLAPILNASDFLAGVAPQKITVAAGAVLWSINNIGIVFIAVFLHPFLKPLSPTVATSYLVTRIIEGTVMMVGIISLLLLIPLSQEFLKAGSPENSWYQTLAATLKQGKVLGISQVSLPLLGLGGVIFTWLLLRKQMVPLFISLTGLVGYALVFLGGLAGWFDVLDTSPFSPASFLAIPVAVFEILMLPFWLFFKGFSTATFPVSQGANQ